MSEDIPSFSKRIGLESMEKKIQVNNIDNDLRHSLWNAITDYYLSYLSKGIIGDSTTTRRFFHTVWKTFFKFPVDEIPLYGYQATSNLKEFYYKLPWNRVYELIEFLPRNITERKNEFINCSNDILVRESSGYRFVNGVLTTITSPEEIKEISKASSTPLNVVNTHINRSLELLSDKQKPDPRNSIKESISAVEALCQQIVGKESAALGDALNLIRDKGHIHLPQPLRDALNKIYGYTSSSEGIRHALSDEGTITVDEARFMLISCSAFINYMILKASEAGIPLK